LKVLILHGMLHLAGYDHESDKGEMARKEDQIRLQLDLPKSLILRGKVSDVGAGRGKKTGSRRKPDRIGKVRAAASARSTRTFREGVLPKGKARPVANR
jgi:hypothetical protein